MRPVVRLSPIECGRRRYSVVATPTLRINAARLHKTLYDTCQWGSANRYGEGPTQTGMNRLALTDDDMAVREWFRGAREDLRAKVTVDQFGNMFAQKKGKAKSSAPMISMGSHLDTQPREGREEGARFPISMMASGTWAGKIPLDTAWNTRDVFDASKTVKSELARHGLIGSVACSHEVYPLGAHFELHIEQSPVLQDTGRKIGVVQGSQAYQWFTIHVTGRDSHTRTTPLYMRSDPLLAAAKMISRAHEIAKSHGALAWTGIFKVPATSSTNTITANVSFSMDVRHPENSVVATVVEEINKSFAKIAKEDGKGVSYTTKLDTYSPADGVSHHPEEYTSPQDCALGTQTLLGAVVEYDKANECLA
ncbi:hypothetical protein MY4824_009102 [Beauveria thailandica]